MELLVCVFLALILGCFILLLVNLRAFLAAIPTIIEGAAVKIVETALQRLNVSASHTSRRQNAVEGAMALDFINMAAPPWLRMALEAMPELKKKISKNPNFLGPAIELLARKNGEAQPPQEELTGNEMEI